MSDTILVLDEGTSSTRAALVGPDGACRLAAQQPLTTRFPQPGWVEQDAEEIWSRTLAGARAALDRPEGRGVQALAIANQRETIVFWNRRTGRALAPAIVWQDRRSAERCAALREAGHEPAVQRATGLLLDPYFSATKIGWALDHWPQLREAGGDLALGTIDSWLLFKLTGRHATDATNASRTLLMDLSGGWDEGLCDLFGVPRTALPTIVDNAGELGACAPAVLGRALPVVAMIGDQQSAALGHGCLAPGDTKGTFGTGAFVLTHVGDPPPGSSNRLLSTVAWQLAGERRYALEGSLFVAGQVVQWLRDRLGLVASAAETAALAASVPDSGGVRLVPAFAGLGAPHWDAEARGALLGLTLGTGKAEIVRAALEGIANQCAELQRAFAADGAPWSTLRVDGGMAANDFLARDLADLLGVAVERPANVESTVLGAAVLAATQLGWHGSLDQAAQAMRGPVVTFEPAGDDDARQQRMAAWARAVAAVRSVGA